MYTYIQTIVQNIKSLELREHDMFNPTPKAPHSPQADPWSDYLTRSWVPHHLWLCVLMPLDRNWFTRWDSDIADDEFS